MTKAHLEYSGFFFLLWVCPLFLQTSEPAEHVNRQESQTASHAQSFSHGSHSRATHSQVYRDPSISSSSTQQTSQLPSRHHQSESHASDGKVPSGVANALEHIIGQLDILTQVSKRCAKLSWQIACDPSRQMWDQSTDTEGLKSPLLGSSLVH